VVTAGADSTVRVWDAATSQEVIVLKGHRGIVPTAVFNHDGKQILSAGEDHFAKVWDAEKGQGVLALKGPPGQARGVAFSPDSTRIASTFGVWDAADGRKLFAFEGASGPVAWSPDGNWIVNGTGHTATVREAATGKQIRTLEGHSGELLGVAISPDGHRIATSAHHQDAPGAVRIWDAETGHQLLAIKGLTGRVWNVAFSEDSKRIVTVDDRQAILWDALNGQELLHLAEGHTHEIWSTAFSRDGRFIVTGCLDKMVRVWNAKTGKLMQTLKGHTAGVWSVAFSPDGSRIVSAGNDATVRVWDAVNGQELLTLKGSGEMFSVAFSPDGKRLAAGGNDGVVRVWVAESGQPPRTNDERAEVLKHRLPAVLSGAEKPADNVERLVFANLATGSGRHAFAARLWLEAMAVDPKLAEDREAALRYRAARAAALAANGPGSEFEKKNFRGLALDWLKAEFQASRPVLVSGAPSDRELTLYKLSVWRREPDLAGIRDAAALEKLPPEEREAAARFWSDYANVMNAANFEHGAFLAKELAEKRKATRQNGGELAYVLARLGRIHCEQEQWAEAEPYLRECLALREKHTPDTWTTFNTLSSLGGVLLGQKKYAEAEPMLLKGYRGMRERESTIPPIGKDRIPDALDRLVELYVALDKPEEVKRWQTERAKRK
jgi:WD40 repeat protein/tetratricopeptide (TPR) repeat protein